MGTIQDINIRSILSCELKETYVLNMYSYIMFAVLCVAYATAGKPGGEEKMTMEEILATKDILDGINQEVERYNLKRLNEYRVVRHSILRATKQVVAGMLYQVKVNMVESECKNVKENDGKTIEECPAKAGKRTRICLFSIWSRQTPHKDLKTKMICFLGNQ